MNIIRKYCLFGCLLLLFLSCSISQDDDNYVTISFYKSKFKKSSVSLSDVSYVTITIKAKNELIGSSNIGIENKRYNLNKSGDISISLLRGKYEITSLNLFKSDDTKIFYTPTKNDKNQSNVSKPLPIEFDIPPSTKLKVEVIEADETTSTIDGDIELSLVDTYKYNIITKDDKSNDLKGVNMVIYKKSSSSSRRWTIIYNGIPEKNSNKVVIRFKKNSSSHRYKIEIAKPMYLTSWIAEGTNTNYKNNPLAVINLINSQYMIKWDNNLDNGIGGANFRDIDSVYWKGTFEKHNTKTSFLRVSNQDDLLEWKKDIESGKDYRLTLEVFAEDGATNLAELEIGLADTKIYLKKGGTGDGSAVNKPLGIGTMLSPKKLDKLYKAVTNSNSSKFYIKYGSEKDKVYFGFLALRKLN